MKLSLLHPHHVAAVAITAFFLANSPVSAEQDDGPMIRDLIAKAVSEKQSSVRIPPGRYTIGSDPAAPEAHLYLRDIRGLEIDATGVELICKDFFTASGIVLFRCENVTLKGFTIDADRVLFTQGKIVAIADDSTHYDLEVDAGYSNDLDWLANPRPMNVFDPKTLLWKNEVADVYINKLERLDNGHLRVWGTRPYPEYKVSVGDPAVIPIFSSSCGITARQCKDLTYERVTIYQSGTMAFHEHGGEGNTALLQCVVDRRPGSGRLISTNADGFHCRNMRKGPTVIDSTFRFMHDDGINIHGNFGFVLEAPGSGNEYKVFSEQDIQVGDTVIFMKRGASTPVGSAKILACKPLPPLPAEELDEWRKSFYVTGNPVAVTLDHAIPTQRGDGFISLSSSGMGFVIRGCTFGPLRYRGMLLQTWNGVVDRNVIRETGSNGIVLQGSSKGEGPYCHNVAILNNAFENIGAFPGRGNGIVCITAFWPPGDPPQKIGISHSGILIQDNTFTNTKAHGIQVVRSSNMIVDGNQFEKIGANNPEPKSLEPVTVTESENIFLLGNTNDGATY